MNWAAMTMIMGGGRCWKRDDRERIFWMLVFWRGRLLVSALMFLRAERLAAARRHGGDQHMTASGCLGSACTEGKPEV
jgi:hypothetical protein